MGTNPIIVPSKMRGDYNGNEKRLPSCLKELRKTEKTKNYKRTHFKKYWCHLKSAAEVKKAYYSYPNYEEKIEEFGILAFELK